MEWDTKVCELQPLWISLSLTLTFQQTAHKMSSGRDACIATLPPQVYFEAFFFQRMLWFFPKSNQCFPVFLTSTALRRENCRQSRITLKASGNFWALTELRTFAGFENSKQNKTTPTACKKSTKTLLFVGSERAQERGLKFAGSLLCTDASGHMPCLWNLRRSKKGFAIPSDKITFELSKAGLTLLVNVTKETRKCGSDISPRCTWSQVWSFNWYLTNCLVVSVLYLPHMSAREANRRHPTRPPSGYKAMATTMRSKRMLWWMPSSLLCSSVTL